MNFFNPQVTLKFPGTLVHSGVGPGTHTDLDLSSVVGSRKALVILRITKDATAGNDNYNFRTNGQTGNAPANGIGWITLGASAMGYVEVITDSSGIIEWYTDDIVPSVNINVEAFIA